MSAATYQPELIDDDPRTESSSGIMADLREFIQASRECGGLLTPKQAAKILDVGSNQISVWASRGRLKSKVVLGVKMVSAGEVLALHRERLEEGIRTGGRGMKAPSLSDMVVGAWRDIEPLK